MGEQKQKARRVGRATQNHSGDYHQKSHLEQGLTGACRSMISEVISQTGAPPKYARASFRVCFGGKVYEYSALLKSTGGSK
jgi:hypothetical protein